MRELIPYSKVQNMACEKFNGKGIGRFMGTESVAQDLERMSRALWRKSDVEKGVNFWGFSESNRGGTLERMESNEADYFLLSTRLFFQATEVSPVSLIFSYETFQRLIYHPYYTFTSCSWSVPVRRTFLTRRDQLRDSTRRFLLFQHRNLP